MTVEWLPYEAVIPINAVCDRSVSEDLANHEIEVLPLCFTRCKSGHRRRVYNSLAGRCKYDGRECLNPIQSATPVELHGRKVAPKLNGAVVSMVGVVMWTPSFTRLYSQGDFFGLSVNCTGFPNCH